MEGMKPLSGKLSKLIIKSNRFGQALSDTTHYLNMKNIQLSDEGRYLEPKTSFKRMPTSFLFFTLIGISIILESRNKIINHDSSQNIPYR